MKHIHRCIIKRTECTEEGTCQFQQKAIDLELKEAAKPLLDFLYEYGTPHSTIIVQQDHVEFLQGECAAPFELRD